MVIRVDTSLRGVSGVASFFFFFFFLFAGALFLFVQSLKEIVGFLKFFLLNSHIPFGFFILFFSPKKHKASNF